MAETKGPGEQRVRYPLREEGSSLKVLAIAPLVLWVLLSITLMANFDAVDRQQEPLISPSFVFWVGIDVVLAVAVVVLFVGGYMLVAIADASRSDAADASDGAT